MVHIPLKLLILALSQFCSFQDDEILKNPGFEDPINNDWICVGACTVERTNEDAYQGQWSGKVTGR